MLDMGGDNYYPVSPARESWYPNVRGRLDNYANYRLTFRVPRNLQTVATGSRIAQTRRTISPSQRCRQALIPVAGFILKDYDEFWELKRKRLLEKNAYGQRNVDVGPVTMGNRVNTSRSGGGVYQSLIYPKGAYILHMLQMMYFTPKEGSKPFKEAMKDFVATYRNRTATTEDFKAVMERHLPPQADINGDHRLDWFLDEFVYGTEVPRYSVESSFSKQGDETMMTYKITQSSVSPQFAMVIHLYLEFDNKAVKRIANVVMRGSKTLDGTISLGKLGPATVTRLLLNYNHDVLCTN